MLKSNLFLFSFLVGLVCLGDGLPRENRTYTLFLRDIPHSGASCHSLAQEIAEKFTRLTTYSAKGRCQDLKENSFDLTLQYEAPQAVEFITSSPDLDFPGRGYEFSSRRVCEAHLEAEREFYRSLHGKEPLLLLCRSQANYYGRVRWELAIYGIAESRTLPHWASSRFPGKPTASQVQQVLQDVVKNFRTSDLNVRFPFLQDGESAELRFTAFYYGRYGEQLKAFSLAEVNSLNECEQEQAQLKQLQHSKPSLVTLGYCVHNPYVRGANLVAIADVVKWYRLNQAVENFKSYQDCSSQRPALLKFYQQELGDKVVAGFCTRWGSQWKLNLVHQP